MPHKAHLLEIGCEKSEKKENRTEQKRIRTKQKRNGVAQRTAEINLKIHKNDRRVYAT